MTSYILEVIYEKEYRKSKQQHINLLKKYEPPENFHTNPVSDIMNKLLSVFMGVYSASNSFKFTSLFLTQVLQKLSSLMFDNMFDVMENINKTYQLAMQFAIETLREDAYLKMYIMGGNDDFNLFLDTVGPTIKYFAQLPKNDVKQMSNLILNFDKNKKMYDAILKNQFIIPYGTSLITFLIVTGLGLKCLPMLSPNNKRSGYMYLPDLKAESKLDGNDVVIYLTKENFNPIIDEMAQKQGGQNIKEIVTESTIHVFYEFKSTDMKASRSIKRFLYTLPPNVFLRFIYKLDSSSDSKGKNNSLTKNIENGFILYPMKENSKDIKDKEDLEILKYADTHVKFYKKHNNNVRYLLDVIPPLRLFGKYLPKRMIPPKWSPQNIKSLA